MKKTIYILIWFEAVDVDDLVAGVFTSQEEIDANHEELIKEYGNDRWQQVTREITL